MCQPVSTTPVCILLSLASFVATGAVGGRSSAQWRGASLLAHRSFWCKGVMLSVEEKELVDVPVTAEM